jgi:enoyl-[acyl-carrier protein] reductase I
LGAELAVTYLNDKAKKALLDKAKEKAPARSLVSIDDVGIATAFLAHDAARVTTGETLYIDGGYHIID